MLGIVADSTYIDTIVRDVASQRVGQAGCYKPGA